MSGKQETNPNQMVLACSAELVPEAVYPEVDPEKRIALTSLLGVIRGSIEPHRRGWRLEDYFHAEPGFICGGLFIDPKHPRYHQAQHAIRLGVRQQSNPEFSDNVAVIYPPTEYSTVARNARDLGRHVVNKTARARLTDPDRQEAKKTAMRSAGHALQAKIHSQEQLEEIYREERKVFVALYRDLKYPLRTRYKAKNLERYRSQADEKFHETIEVASVFLELDNTELRGIHRVIRRRLYNGNHSRSEFAFNWMRYLQVIGLHNAAKNKKLALSKDMCQKELKEYQPYLDEKDRYLHEAA